MKKILTPIVIAIILFAITNNINAQSTAKDFSRKDCKGKVHHLFQDLDSGKVVILEFFMQNCGPCINAGNKLEAMKSKLQAQYPGKIKSYAIGYINSYSCSSNAAWVSSNGFTSIPMDSGAAQVAYYGGMGMPTIVILGGGNKHLVLGSPYIGFSTNDTIKMISDIKKSFNPTSINTFKSTVSGMDVYPNPLNNTLNLSFNVSVTNQIKIDISDISGKSIVTLMNETITSGPFSRLFDLSTLPSGYYIVNLNSNGMNSHYKINILH